MKKKMSFLLTAVMLIAVLSGCSGGSAPSGDTPSSGSQAAEQEPAGQESITLVLGATCPVSEENQLWQWAEKYKSLLAEATNGRIILDCHYAGELGGERDLFEGVQLGTVDMCIISNGPVGNFVSDTLAFDFPFLFRDYDHVMKVFEGEIGDRLLKVVEEKTDVVMLDWAANGFRQTTNSKHPIAHPSDFSDIKLRTMENPIHIEAFRAMGANAGPMSNGELYTVLQQGTFDGMESPLTYIIPSKFYEVQKYLSVTNHFYAPSVIPMNKARFDSLSAEDQQLMLDLAHEATLYQYDWLSGKDAELIEKAPTEYNMEVTICDMEEFREATQSVYDNHPEYAEILAEIEAVQ